MPIINRVVKVDIRTKTVDVPEQEAITRDNVSIRINAVLYYKIFDASKAVISVENYNYAVSQLAQTTMRNIVGSVTLDELLSERDKLSTQICQIVDEATDPWGIKVNRVELKSILPPEDIRVAMEKEMKAEREKRANILEAQAKKESAILVAEGNKQAAILNAEAEKETAIKRAEGQAQAILAIQKAQAESLRVLSEADPSQKVLTLKGLEAFQKVADGKATKIIIPTELSGLASLATSFAELNQKVEIKKE